VQLWSIKLPFCEIHIELYIQSWQDVAGILNNFVEFIQAFTVLLIGNVHFEVSQVICGDDVFEAEMNGQGIY